MIDWISRKSQARNRTNGRNHYASRRLIDLQQVVKVYEGGAGSFQALKGIDLQIDAGEFVAVVGKSGSGKSTLLNMMTGIDRPTSGEVWVAGAPLHRFNENKMAIWRGKNLGIVFQFFQLLPTLTVVENVMLPMDFSHVYTVRARRQRALALLDQFDLLEQANKLPAALSGGQQQRVAIARALANDPPLVVADEPTGNLDSKTALNVFDIFEELVKQGKTILMVTHDQDLAGRIPRTIFLVDGQISEEVRAEEVVELPEEFQNLNLTPAGGIYGEGPDVLAIRQRVLEILSNRSTAAQKLQQELQNASENQQLSDTLYQIILEEIRSAALRAEKSGRRAEAREWWKILIDATQPWAQKQAGKK